MAKYKVLKDVTIDEVEYKAAVSADPEIIDLDEEVGEEFVASGELELVANEQAKPTEEATDEKKDDGSGSSENTNPASK